MASEEFILKEELENKKLNELLNDVRVDPSETNMVELLREAAASRFIVPLSFQDDGTPSLQAMAGKEGKTYMVVYADTKSYQVRADGQPLYGVISSFEEVLDTCMASDSISGFVINPGLEEVLFGKDMLQMIAQMMQTVDNSAKVGEPDHYPPKLRDMLKEYLNVEPAVQKVWVRLMRMTKTNTLQWLLIIDGDLGEQKQYIIETFSNFIKPYLDGMDLLCVTPEEQFAASVINGAKPFIERSEIQ